MNTSEVLDLSKENIQPLKQGRNPVKLGTALQAQTNVELHQKLLAEREQFELLIRMYDGDDPLKPHYDYVHWIEQSFPKHGPESNLVQILENTLTTFKDDERYKQDLRYAELLIKYIDTQPNPIEIYQLVYNQGLCTMCATFYKAWADELDKSNNYKKADQIYELGIKVKAQPFDLLQEAHRQFQLSVGRRMLAHLEENNEVETDYNRQALHKLQKQNIYSVRDPTGAPGRIKQQTLGTHNSQKAAPFKLYQDEDKEYNAFSESKGKVFPKNNLINKENTLKAGPWSQGGGKHRSRGHTPTTLNPTFQVHEDEGAAIENGAHRTPTVPRALKTRKIDNFTCPLAVFEPPDPSKKPMYCKNKVYAGGREFQFEELRAALYNRRFLALTALKIQQEAEKERHSSKEVVENKMVLPEVKPEVPSDEVQVEKNELIINQYPKTVVIESTEEQPLKMPNMPFQEENQEMKPSRNLEISEENKIPSFQEQQFEKMIFGGKTIPLEANASLSHSQSFTVNTKEAMNVVQEMWNSPSPAPAFGMNARTSRAAHPSSPLGLDESGVFKVPALPPPSCKTDDAPVVSSVPKITTSFPIFFDDEPVNPPFQIYSDDAEPKQSQTNNENIKKETQSESNPVSPLHNLHLVLQPSGPSQFEGPRVHKPDAGTLKMLAFDSDSDDSNDDVPKLTKNIVENSNNNNPAPNIPMISVTAPTPQMEVKRKSFGVDALHHFAIQDEDKFDDMTCNTKAFDFVLPSSTPLVGHFKNTNGQLVKHNINGSYITEEIKKCATNQELSMIFEASKERYSSSSGSSGSKTQGSVCTVANTSVPPVQPELMEKLAQISASSDSVGELEKSLDLLKISGPVDPFSTDLIIQLLSHIKYPKKHHLIGLHRFETEAPALHTNSTVKLGPTKYSVIGELGKGSYARVLKATKEGEPVALKQQRPAWEWEWYIVQELQNRLPANMMSGFLHMSNGFIYKNASILESEWAQFGSILSVVNKLKTAGKGHDPQLALLFSIHFISIVEHLHKCKIIHGDIKPDNFVLFSIPSVDLSKPCLKLIDFGRSIDMTLFPEGTTFNVVVTTDGFQCNEMKDGQPWTYQTDLYGLAGSIYCVLFYDYMKVTKKGGKWQLSNKIPRYMMPALWQEIFTPLLNVESCENLPDLITLREALEQRYKIIDHSTVSQSINKLSNALLKK